MKALLEVQTSHIAPSDMPRNSTSDSSPKLASDSDNQPNGGMLKEVAVANHTRWRRGSSAVSDIALRNLVGSLHPFEQARLA